LAFSPSVWSPSVWSPSVWSPLTFDPRNWHRPISACCPRRGVLSGTDAQRSAFRRRPEPATSS
jgi:hypothetical protein